MVPSARVVKPLAGRPNKSASVLRMAASAVTVAAGAHVAARTAGTHLRVSLAIVPPYFGSTVPNEDVSGLHTWARSRLSQPPPTQPEKTVEWKDRPEHEQDAAGLCALHGVAAWPSGSAHAPVSDTTRGPAAGAAARGRGGCQHPTHAAGAGQRGDGGGVHASCRCRACARARGWARRGAWSPRRIHDRQRAVARRLDVRTRLCKHIQRAEPSER